MSYVLATTKQPFDGITFRSAVNLSQVFLKEYIQLHFKDQKYEEQDEGADRKEAQ